MKRKLTAITLVLIMLFSILSLSGCTAKESKKDMLATIKEKGEITIATEGTWAPWTFHDGNDKLVGFDVEVAQKVADKLGVKANFVECEWDGILAGFDAKRFDIIANGFEIDEGRKEKYDFTDAYAYIRTAIIVKSDNDSIKSFDDLSGKTTANTLASTYAILGEKYGAKTTGVDSLDQTLDLVLAGRVDATLNAEVSYYDYMKAHPDTQLKIAALTEEASLVAFPVEKGEGSKTFIEAVNKAIAELAQEGVLEELSIKYFGSDITKAN